MRLFTYVHENACREREKLLLLTKIPRRTFFFEFLDLHRPQDVSIALDFLAQETQVSHAHAKRSSTRGYIQVCLKQESHLYWSGSYGCTCSTSS